MWLGAVWVRAGAASSSTATAESGITYIRRFIRSPPICTSNFSTNCNKTQKVGKAGRDSSWHLVLFGLDGPALAKHPGGRYAPPRILGLLAGRPFKLAPLSHIALGKNFPFPNKGAIKASLGGCTSPHGQHEIL